MISQRTPRFDFFIDTALPIAVTRLRVVGPGLAMAIAVTIAMPAAQASAGAQTVYRCGTDGRTYSQEPCANGQKLDASDPRTPEQRAEGERAVAREKALGDNLERERRATEASQRAATAAASFKARPAAASTPAIRHIIRRR